jgi:hypothetical protein
MKSAFGVDHGDYEVEKALGMGALKPLGAAFKAGKSGQIGAAANAMQGHAMGLGRMAGKVQGSKIGQFGMKNKFALGVGGAAAGGAAGGSLLNRRR